MNVTLIHGDACAGYAAVGVRHLGGRRRRLRPVAELVEDGDWSAKLKRTLLLYPRGAVAARRLLLVGLGKRSAFSASKLREVAAVARAARARPEGRAL